MTDLKFLFGFKGRINRYQLLLGQIFSVVPMVLISMLSEAIADPIRKYILAITFIVAPIISLSISIKRLHDVNRSGFFLLLAVVPLINLYLLFLYISPGTAGPNKYGPPPG